MINRSTGSYLPTRRVRRSLFGLVLALMTVGLLIVAPASPALAAKLPSGADAPVTFTIKAQVPLGPAKASTMQAMGTILITCVMQENYPTTPAM